MHFVSFRCVIEARACVLVGERVVSRAERSQILWKVDLGAAKDRSQCKQPTGGIFLVPIYPSRTRARACKR